MVLRAHEAGQWRLDSGGPDSITRWLPATSQPFPSGSTPKHTLHAPHHLPVPPLHPVSRRGSHLPRLRRESDRSQSVLHLQARQTHRTHLNSAHNPALTEETPPQASLHPSSSFPKSFAPPPQHLDDPQQEPRESARPPHRRRDHKQVGHEEINHRVQTLTYYKKGRQMYFVKVFNTIKPTLSYLIHTFLVKL